jgi:hypothetical protein
MGVATTGGGTGRRSRWSMARNGRAIGGGTMRVIGFNRSTNADRLGGSCGGVDASGFSFQYARWPGRNADKSTPATRILEPADNGSQWAVDRSADGVSSMRPTSAHPYANRCSRGTRTHRVVFLIRSCVPRRRSAPRCGSRTGLWVDRPSASATSPGSALCGLVVAGALTQSCPTECPERTTRFGAGS